MALFKPFRGSRASLDMQPLHDGYAYFCTDDGTFHIDYTDADGNLQRKQLNAKDAETLGLHLPEDFLLKDNLPTELKQLKDSLILTLNVTEANTTISFSNLTNVVEINWGDGTIDAQTTHVYTDPNKYIAVISGVTSIGSNAFIRCSSLTSIEIPDSITSIGNNAFENCSSLESVIIGNGVTSIGNYAFLRCGALTNIVIPDNVTFIGDQIFAYCSSLMNVTFGKNVTSIGNGIVFYKTSLSGIKLNALTPPVIGDNIFGGASITRIEVPAQSLEAYKTATNWSQYSHLMVGVDVDTNYFADTYVKQDAFNDIVTELTEDYFTITSSYNERVTAQGKKIANGDVAILEKIEGNTVVSGKDANGMNGTATNATFGGIRSCGINLTDGVTQVHPTLGGVYRRLDLNLPIADSYTIYVSKPILLQGVGSSVKILRGGTGQLFRIQITSDDVTNQWLSMRLDPNGTPWDDSVEISIFKGNYDESSLPSYAPGGVDEFIFSQTELPLGKTIDFVNKKILNYAVKIELTGKEGYSRYPSFKPGSVYTNCLPVAENYAHGVSTDGEVIISSSLNALNTIIIGQGSKVIYFIGILDTLGFTDNWVDKSNPTTEEADEAVNAFKAYLEQRYASGNPVTIYYISSTLQSEESFTEEQLAVGNTYKAWEGGTEVVIGGNEVQATFTQKYNTSIFSRLDNLDKQINGLEYTVATTTDINALFNIA